MNDRDRQRTADGGWDDAGHDEQRVWEDAGNDKRQPDTQNDGGWGDAAQTASPCSRGGLRRLATRDMGWL
jgi:hypothetical protein